MANLTYNTITTEDDYLRATGVDLNEELIARLTDDIGDNNPAPRFIYQVENYLKEKIVAHNPIDYSSDILNDTYTFNEHQTKQFKRAVMYQISFLLKNGNITNDLNELIPREQMELLGLDSNAQRSLYLGGLWNVRRC
jgi:hypothetical protein